MVSRILLSPLHVGGPRYVFQLITFSVIGGAACYDFLFIITELFVGRCSYISNQFILGFSFSFL